MILPMTYSRFTTILARYSRPGLSKRFNEASCRRASDISSAKNRCRKSTTDKISWNFCCWTCAVRVFSSCSATLQHSIMGPLASITSILPWPVAIACAWSGTQKFASRKNRVEYLTMRSIIQKDFLIYDDGMQKISRLWILPRFSSLVLLLLSSMKKVCNPANHN